jgi:hypothetical protein
MNSVTIQIKPIGKNELQEMFNQLNDFVKENFNLLYEGAIRLGCNIENDYYAPRRIQFNKTRLHAHQGLKYADGFKYNEDGYPTEENIKNSVSDIQSLIDAASEDIKASFCITIQTK